MMRAQEVLAAGAWTGEPADSVVLDFDERSCRRATLTAVGGLAFQLDLAGDTMLRGGDGLKLDDGRVVEVVAAPEPLFELRAEPLALIRLALRLGNAHALVEAAAKALRVRRDPGVEALAKSLGARVTPVEAPFNPEGAAYVIGAAHDHDHGHDHHHGHGHDHDHDHHGHGHDRHHHDHSHNHDHGHGHDHGAGHAG